MSEIVTWKLLGNGGFLHRNLGSVRFGVEGVMWRGGHDGHIFRILDMNGRTAGSGVICRSWVIYWGIIMVVRIVWDRRITNFVIICLSLGELHRCGSWRVCRRVIVICLGWSRWTHWRVMGNVIVPGFRVCLLFYLWGS